MKTIISYASIATFFACAYNSPVITILAVIVALLVANVIADFLTARKVEDAKLATHYQQVKAAFCDMLDEETPTTEDSQDDIWDVTEVTSCDFACPVSFLVKPVLALPAAQEDVTHAIFIDYAAMTYKELQQLCKAQRKSKSDIKLNAKKSVLIEWLATNL